MRNQKSTDRLLFISVVTILIIAAFAQTGDLQTSTPLPQVPTTTHSPTNKLSSMITPVQIETVVPSQTPTPKSIGSPGFIVTLGEDTPSPWRSGVVAFSPDGQIIAHATTRIRFWDAQTHQLIRELKNPYPKYCHFRRASFSPDGSLFAVSITNCWGEKVEQVGHLVVWDALTGKLLHEWRQEYAEMVEAKHSPPTYRIPVYAMAFLPDSSRIAFASGNTIEIRDIRENDSPAIFELGKNMYATDTSVRDDGEFISIFMKWDKFNTFPLAYSIEYRLQIWHVNTASLRIAQEFPDIDYPYEEFWLHGDHLVRKNATTGEIQARNLFTEEIREFPYRRGTIIFNSGMSLMIAARTRYWHTQDDESNIELWNSDNWRNIYSFWPDLKEGRRFYLDDIVFNSDNTILAFDHQEQVTLWDIAPVVNP